MGAIRTKGFRGGIAALGVLIVATGPVVGADGGLSPVAKGREAYQMYCEPCHGRTGDGDGPLARDLASAPVSFRDPTWQAGRSDGELTEYIRDGGGETHGRPMMPSWVSVLRGEDVSNVIAYIRSLVTP